MHPKILLRYAEELQVNNVKNIEDIAFCYHVFQNRGEVEKNVVETYLQDKWGNQIKKDEKTQRNGMYFERLEELLNQETDNQDKRPKHRIIFVE